MSLMRQKWYIAMIADKATGEKANLIPTCMDIWIIQSQYNFIHKKMLAKNVKVLLGALNNWEILLDLYSGMKQD